MFNQINFVYLCMKATIEVYLNDIIKGRSDNKLCPAVFAALQSNLRQFLDGRYKIFVLAASDTSAIIKYQGVEYHTYYDYEKEKYIVR